MSLPVCPTNCTSNLPTLDFTKCNPQINAAQISRVFFTTVGNPMINWASEVGWDSRIDNDAVGAAMIRAIIGIGDMPAPEATEKEISLGRKIQGKRNFTVNFRVDETNQTNHDAFRLLQCNTGNFLFWFETRDKLIFGGNSGIEGQIKADIVVAESYDDIIIYQLTFTWEA